jgi:hypothetical protein
MERWISIGRPYCGGMRIEYHMVLEQFPVTILTGRVPDQAVLIGVIDTLFERGCPLQAARVPGSARGFKRRRGSGRQRYGFKQLE